MKAVPRSPANMHKNYYLFVATLKDGKTSHVRATLATEDMEKVSEEIRTRPEVRSHEVFKRIEYTRKSYEEDFDPANLETFLKSLPDNPDGQKQLRNAIHLARQLGADSKPLIKETSKSNQIESWRSIPGFSRYDASNLGKIRRCLHIATIRKNPGKIMSQSSCRGYASVCLVSDDGIKSTQRVCRLVLFAFAGMPETDRLCAAHNNGDKSDNRIENLRWATSLENNKDRMKHGTIPKGEKVTNSKLTDNAVREIRKLYAAGFVSQAQLAKKYGVNQTLIGFVVRRVKWKHVV